VRFFKRLKWLDIQRDILVSLEFSARDDRSAFLMRIELFIFIVFIARFMCRCMFDYIYYIHLLPLSLYNIYIYIYIYIYVFFLILHAFPVKFQISKSSAFRERKMSWNLSFFNSASSGRRIKFPNQIRKLLVISQLSQDRKRI